MNAIWAHAALALVALIYGVNYPLAKWIMPAYISPSAFIVLRVFGAAVLFWLADAFGPRRRPDRADFPLLIECAVLGVALNQLAFFHGLNLTSAINASVIMAINPILVLVLSAWLLRTAMSVRLWLGVLLGAAGATALIAYSGAMGVAQRDSNALGDALIVLNALSYALYLVRVKALMNRYPPLLIIKWIFTFALFLVLPFGYSEALAINWAAMPDAVLWGVAFVVVFVTFLAYLLNVVAIKWLSPTAVSAYIYLQPVIAGILAIAWGNASLHWIQPVAAVLIFVGVYATSASPRS